MKSLCAIRLCAAVDTILDKASGYSEKVETVLDQLNMVLKDTNDYSDEWFRGLLLLSKSFDINCMGKLWIRNLSKNLCDSRTKNPQGSFYITDGNHRALIYALKVRFSEVAYEDNPVKAIHATTWSNVSGALTWQAALPHQLEKEGEFDQFQEGKLYRLERRYTVSSE